MSTEKLFPKLRFAGFNETWKKHDLMEVINEFYNGQTPSRSNLSYWNGNIPWTSVSDLNYGFITDTLEKITDLGKESANLKILPKDTFIIAIVGLEAKGTRGSCALLGIDSTINQACLALIPNKNKLDKLFMVQWYLYVGEKYGIKYTQGTKQQNYNIDLLKKLPIIIPVSIKEQCKIGSFLFKIDEKIRLLQEKQHHYQNFKKYLMQQIFAQKLRFDFDDEWKTMRLNEIVFYQEGPGVRNYQYTKSGVKLLNVGNFVNNVLELDNTDRYISEEEAYGKYNHFLVDEGDLLIACSGIKAEYFDEKIAFAEKKHLPLCMNTSTMRFKSLDENLLNLNYLKCYFQTESFKKQVFRVMTGSAQFNFGPTHLKYFKIPIPSIDEQKQIYELIGSVDNKISMINGELVKVNEFKKGLLQQMFV